MNPTDDPRPEPPREPALEECCGSGCDPCVFDRYQTALDRFRIELDAWLKRHPGEGEQGGGSAGPGHRLSG